MFYQNKVHVSQKRGEKTLVPVTTCDAPKYKVKP
jgi:hypothetical protein